jgi:hypothetical protein
MSSTSEVKVTHKGSSVMAEVVFKSSAERAWSFPPGRPFTISVSTQFSSPGSENLAAKAKQSDAALSFVWSDRPRCFENTEETLEIFCERFQGGFLHGALRRPSGKLSGSSLSKKHRADGLDVKGISLPDIRVVRVKSGHDITLNQIFLFVGAKLSAARRKVVQVYTKRTNTFFGTLPTYR